MSPEYGELKELMQNNTQRIVILYFAYSRIMVPLMTATFNEAFTVSLNYVCVCLLFKTIVSKIVTPDNQIIIEHN